MIHNPGDVVTPIVANPGEEVGVVIGGRSGITVIGYGDEDGTQRWLEVPDEHLMLADIDAAVGNWAALLICYDTPAQMLASITEGESS